MNKNLAIFLINLIMAIETLKENLFLIFLIFNITFWL
jgi:hypothetical protein